MKITHRAVWAFAAALLMAPAAHPAPRTADPSSVVILDVEQNEGDLSPAWRAAVERAIAAVAKSADVVVCLGDQPSVADTALATVCAGLERDFPHLWWTAKIETLDRKGLKFLRLALSLEASPEPSSGIAQLVVLTETPLRNSGTKELEAGVASEIAAVLPSLPDLNLWFEALKLRPELLRPWPAATAAATEDTDGGDDAPAVEDSVTEEAPLAEEAPATEKAPDAPRRKVEIHGKESSFLVREALVGGGFDAGANGRLSLGPAGISFIRNGQKREDWKVTWQALAEARKDDGIWDVPYPLVIIDREGRRRYIARIDGRGRYLPGDPILAAIQRKGRGEPAPADESSGAKSPEGDFRKIHW